MKNVVMAFLLFATVIVCSKQIEGEYRYSYNDSETIIDAKQKCLNLAKQNAVERFATFIRSETIVKNYITEKDEIIANSMGMITDVKIINEIIDKANTTVYYKISAEIDEIKVMAMLEEKEKIRSEETAKKREQEERLREIEITRQAELERLRVEAEAKKLEQEERIRAMEEEKLIREKFSFKNEPKRKFWEKQKWIALGTFVGTTGLGIYFNSVSDSYFDDHDTATDTPTAVDSFDKTKDFESYRNITYSVSLVPLGYFFYSWYKERQY